ncbi:unnamed protein product [Closterium sp. NIES-53]
MLSVARIMADEYKLKVPPPVRDAFCFHPGSTAVNSAASSTCAAHPEAMPAAEAGEAHGAGSISGSPDSTHAEPSKLALNSRQHPQLDRLQQEIAARGGSSNTGNQPAAPSKLKLNSRPHPQLLLQLDRLQQEIEARGGHGVLELIPATSSPCYYGSSEMLSSGCREQPKISSSYDPHNNAALATSPGAASRTTAAAAAAAAPAAACTTPSGGSPSTLLPPKSPAGLSRGQGFRQLQRPRQLVRPPSVPARLDSMITMTTARYAARGDGCLQFGTKIPASRSACGAAPPPMRIESPPSSQEFMPIGDDSSESEPERAAVANAEDAGASGGGAGSPPSPLSRAVANHPHAAISVRRHLNGRVSARPFRSSSNIDLAGMDRASLYDDATTTATSSGICSRSDRTPNTISMSSPPALLPASPVSRRYAHRMLVQSQEFEFVRGEHPRHDKPPPRRSSSTSLTSTTNVFTRSTENKKLMGAAQWRSRVSSVADNRNSTNFCEGFSSSGAPSPSSMRNMRLLVHANSSRETGVGGAITPATNDVPSVPAPSPRQPINHSTSGRSFGHKVDSVPCSPRQLQLRERILGIRYSCVRDKFHISKEKIGEGGSGEIRKCLEWSTGTVFACKTIHKSNITNQSEASDLRTEVLLMDLLKSHFGVVQVHEVFEDHKAVHLVMELCNGGDLFDFIQGAPKGRLNERHAASVMRQLLGALHHCHSLGVLHRDVKPENILLCDRVTHQSRDRDVRIKLSDFGVAGFLNEDGVCTDSAGTSEYMAPEVVVKAPYNAKADVWSAGVVLHAMLAGALPSWAALPDEFKEEVDNTGGGNSKGEGKTMQEGIARNELKLKSRVWRGVSEEAKHLLRALLRKDPAERPSALEALGECGAAMHWVRCGSGIGCWASAVQ